MVGVLIVCMPTTVDEEELRHRHTQRTFSFILCSSLCRHSSIACTIEYSFVVRKCNVCVVCLSVWCVCIFIPLRVEVEDECTALFTADVGLNWN